MADFGVTLGCDCWESLTTSRSGVSIVKNVATCQRSDHLKRRRLGAAARLLSSRGQSGTTRGRGISNVMLAMLVGRDASDLKRRQKNRRWCRFWRELARVQVLEVWKDWKSRGAIVPAFPVSELRRIYYTRRGQLRRGDHFDQGGDRVHPHLP